MSTVAIREAIPGLTRAIVAMVLTVAMVAAALVMPAGHGPIDTVSYVSVAASAAGGTDPERGHDTSPCHGCAVHAGHVLPAAASDVLQQVTEADLAAGDDVSPPTPVRAPPVEPPRA